MALVLVGSFRTGMFCGGSGGVGVFYSFVLFAHIINWLKHYLHLHGHVNVLTGRYAYFELKGNLTDSMVLNTGDIKY